MPLTDTGIKAADTGPTAVLRGALQAQETEHHKPLERAEIPTFFTALSAKSRTSRQTEIARRLLAHLSTRPVELRTAPWPELDLEAADWRIPPERAKMKRDTRLIEPQLAHRDQNKSRASYDHSVRLPERRARMQAWADLLDSLAQPRSNIVPLHAPSALLVR